MWRRRSSGPGEGGAAVVEFALVMPILCLILFGIIDYGLFFNNSLSVRQGVRETARQGVVETPATGACAAKTGYMAQLACTAKAQVGAVTGTTYAKAFYTTWATGQSLTVCSVVKTTGLIGMVPLPNKGYTTSRTNMSIEVANPVPAGTTSYADTLPSGVTWSWCS